jgi:hypothetical protein
VPNVPSGYANVAIPFAHDGLARRAFITFGVDVDVAITTASEVADAVMTALDDSWQSFVSTNVDMGPAIASYNSGGGPVSGEGSTVLSGGSAVDPIPSNGALLVRKSSLLSGRENRGRFYVPWCLEETDVSPLGIIDGTTRSDWQTGMDNFMTELSTNGVPMVILHNGPGSPGPVSQLTVAPIIGTQRRRLRST